MAGVLDRMQNKMGRLGSSKAGGEGRRQLCAEEDHSGCARAGGQAHEENIPVARVGQWGGGHV